MKAAAAGGVTMAAVMAPYVPLTNDVPPPPPVEHCSASVTLPPPPPPAAAMRIAPAETSVEEAQPPGDASTVTSSESGDGNATANAPSLPDAHTPPRTASVTTNPGDATYDPVASAQPGVLSSSCGAEHAAAAGGASLAASRRRADDGTHVKSASRRPPPKYSVLPCAAAPAVSRGCDTGVPPFVQPHTTVTSL